MRDKFAMLRPLGRFPRLAARARAARGAGASDIAVPHTAHAVANGYFVAAEYSNTQ